MLAALGAARSVRRAAPIWNELELPHRAPRLTDMRESVSKWFPIGMVIGITILTLCMLSVVGACGPLALPLTSHFSH